MLLALLRLALLEILFIGRGMKRESSGSSLSPLGVVFGVACLAFRWWRGEGGGCVRRPFLWTHPKEKHRICKVGVKTMSNRPHPIVIVARMGRRRALVAPGAGSHAVV